MVRLYCQLMLSNIFISYNLIERKKPNSLVHLKADHEMGKALVVFLTN